MTFYLNCIQNQGNLRAEVVEPILLKGDLIIAIFECEYSGTFALAFHGSVYHTIMTRLISSQETLKNVAPTGLRVECLYAALMQGGRDCEQQWLKCFLKKLQSDLCLEIELRQKGHMQREDLKRWATHLGYFDRLLWKVTGYCRGFGASSDAVETLNKIGKPKLRQRRNWFSFSCIYSYSLVRLN